MKEVKRSAQWGTTIFCDDVRQELGAKLTYVGVYTSEMVIHVPFPAKLAKFCIVTNYLERPGSNSDPITIKVFQPGSKEDLIAAIELDHNNFRENAPRPTDPEALDPFIGAMFFVNLAPFEVRGEGRIRVVAESGKKFVRLGSLLVRAAKEGDPSPVQF